MITGTRHRLTLEINRQTRLAQEIARKQAEIATTKRILAPSDDPIGAARVGEIARAEANEQTWIRNINTASALAARSDTVLKSVGLSLERANELMIAASTGTLSDANRATIAGELRAIAEEMAAFRETRDPRGEPLFRTNGALEIPVSTGVRIAAVADRASIFDVPVDLVAAISAAATTITDPDPAARKAGSQAALANIALGVSQIANARADQGVRANRLDALREGLENSAVQLEEQRGAIEGTDIPEAIARLESRRISLEAAQAIFARLNKSSLFDLIR
nr:flagellin [uncultured Sphingosinicella sp.]